MTSTQARKKRAKLNAKIKAGKATTADKAEFARLVQLKAKPGRPRKAPPAPEMSWLKGSRAAPPTEAAPSPEASPASLDSDPIVIEELPGAAPGLDFSVPGFASPEEEAAASSTPTPDAPVVPSSAAVALADKIVGGLAYTSTFLGEVMKMDPLLGMGEIVYPALRHAWAQVLEETGLASKADAMMNNKTASRVAVVTSAAYLGGGGVWAMFELKKRAQLAGQPVEVDAQAVKPEQPAATTPAAEPVTLDPFATMAPDPSAPPIVPKPIKLADIPTSATGVAQMAPSFSGAEVKS